MKPDFKEWEKVKKEHDHLFKPQEERQAQLKAKQKEIRRKAVAKFFVWMFMSVLLVGGMLHFFGPGFFTGVGGPVGVLYLYHLITKEDLTEDHEWNW